MEQGIKNMKGVYLISACILYFVLACILVIRFDIGYIPSMLLYFVVPSIYFSLTNPLAIPKNLFYAFSFSIPTAVVFDYMAHVGNVWYVPSVFPIRMLGVFPAEEIVWSFLFFYVILASYNGIHKENFDPEIHSDNNKYILLIILLFMPAFFLLLIFDKELLVVNHFYMMMAICAMAIPSAVAIYFRPWVWKRILPLTVAFAVFFLFYEYSALKTGQWTFPGNYIGWIRLFDVKFPVEELLFALLSVPGTIGLYEFFSNGK